MRVGWCTRDAETGEVLGSSDGDEVFSIASVGKLLLLAEVAAQLDVGTLDGSEPLSRDGSSVADSGLWQHLRSDTLPLEDAALLVASVSDNLATNVLLRRVGLDAVAQRTADLGLRSTALHDQVRDERSAEHPERLASGTANELSSLMTLVPPRVIGWLATGVDLSMVAAAFGLDPLAHITHDRGILLRNKTGSSDGVRCDVGIASSRTGAVAYAVLASYDDGPERDIVLTTMRGIGRGIRIRLAR